jgi:hypothetical protein
MAKITKIKKIIKTTIRTNRNIPITISKIMNQLKIKVIKAVNRINPIKTNL